MVLRLPDSWSNWNLEMLVFEERGKPEYPEKMPSCYRWQRFWAYFLSDSFGKRMDLIRRLMKIMIWIIWKKIIAVIDVTFAVSKRKPEKQSGLYRTRTLDLCDTGAALYLLSLQAKWEQVVELVRYKLVKGWWWRYENMKIIYEKCGVKNYIQCMKEDHRII